MRYRRALFCAAVALSSIPCIAEGGEALRRGDEVWLVSCRGIGDRGGKPNLRQLASWRLTNQGWIGSNQSELSSSHTPFATVVFVPGNGYSHHQTRDLGLRAYQQMVTGAPTDSPVRFVIWSWPSDQASRRPRRDARIKAARTMRVAWCLAHWLDATQPAESVCLVGTGFGAKIVAEALHLRGGGTVGGYQLAAAAPRPPVRAVLISAAFDNDWLLPNRRLDRALANVERLVIVANPTDPVLQRYHWLYGFRSRATALGYTGLVGARQLGADVAKIEQINAASLVGANHGFTYYFSTPRFVAQIQPYALGPNASLLARNPQRRQR